MRILGIESSCDETAAAVVEDGHNVLSNVVVSQIDIHAATGGVIPEVAARSHIEAINPVIAQAIAPVGWDHIDAIAVTTRPGLIGSLMIGSLAARTLAITHAKPFYTIDHILAHIYAAGLETGRSNSGRLETRPSAYQRSASAEPDVETVSRNYSFRFPVVALVVSGGHTSLILMHSHSQHETLGATRDDAVGEAFDKVAKILGLPYPGGPSIAAAAAQARPIHPLPVAKLTGPYDFSFSGLKTAVLRLAQNLAGVGLDTPSGDLAALLSDQRKREIAASFQHTAIATLTQKLDKAIAEYHPRQIIVAGGVSASAALRAALPTAVFPAPEFSTDNAAMAAARAYYQAQFTPPDDPYDTELIPN